jgi:broad specificity phosphatase PhoE
MKLHIVRHGETVWHAENRYCGSSDIGLTEKGIQQSIELAEWAEKADLDLIISSDLSRAFTTAAPSAKACGKDIEIEKRFREVDFGQGEGRTSAEMMVAFPADYQAFIENPGHSPLPDGEAGNVAVDRALAALTEITNRENCEEVLLVAHSTLGRLLICALTGIPLDSYRQVFPMVINGAITTLLVPKVDKSADLYGTGSLLAFNVPTN